MGVRSQRITGSEHKILVAESNFGWCEGYHFDVLYSRVVGPDENPLPQRHSVRAFVGMADGHVELFAPADLTNPMKGPTRHRGNFTVTRSTLITLNSRIESRYRERSEQS